MNLHEYQAKGLFQEFSIPVPDGRVAFSLREAQTAAEELGGDEWVVKAQIYAGGRGKAGGVRKLKGNRHLTQAVSDLLGSRLVTHQTGAQGQLVDRLLIERPCELAREIYLACLVDRATERIVFMAAAEGGMDIEEIAATAPEQILQVRVDPVVGLQAYQCRQLGFRLGLVGPSIKVFTQIMMNIYRLFCAKDLSLVEINPLGVSQEGELIAVDAKITVDENALSRQRALEDLKDPSQEDPKDHKARQFGLNYIALEGSIACMVNGAGLAMATMDLIKLHGGEPANFLDVGGGATAEKVTEAFKLILSDKNVKAILVNIFGGIVRCDVIAEGIINAVRQVATAIPVVVRLEGTHAELGRELLSLTGLKIITAQDLTDAAMQAVEAANK